MPLRYSLTTLAILCLTAGGCRSDRKDSTATAQWALADLGTLADTLRANHPKLLLPAVRERFDSAVGDVSGRIGSLPRDWAVMELARVVATLEDGHTQFGLAWDSVIGFQRYPIRVFLFDEGVYVVSAIRDAAPLLGKRLVRIGPLPAESVMARLGPYLHGDNEMNRRDILENRLTLHEVLATVGATSDTPTFFTVSDSLGRLDSLRLAPLPFGNRPRLVDARDTLHPPPFYRRHPGRTFWFTMVPGTRTMYAQINAIQDDSTLTLAGFADSLFSTMVRGRANRLVIDLRLNNGGDNTLNRALVRRIVQTPAIDRPGHLYVIIGRATFSAAVNLVSDLENFTHAIFVGEPTAAPANHYGEPTLLRLPRSGITPIYSRLYWQGGDPRDARPWIAPSISAPPRFRHLRDNRDPALDTILKLPVPGSR